MPKIYNFDNFTLGNQLEVETLKQRIKSLTIFRALALTLVTLEKNLRVQQKVLDFGD